jgi:hypothetical protein
VVVGRDEPVRIVEHSRESRPLEARQRDDAVGGQNSGRRGREAALGECKWCRRGQELDATRLQELAHHIACPRAEEAERCVLRRHDRDRDVDRAFVDEVGACKQRQLVQR